MGSERRITTALLLTFVLLKKPDKQTGEISAGAQFIGRLLKSIALVLLYRYWSATVNLLYEPHLMGRLAPQQSQTVKLRKWR